MFAKPQFLREGISETAPFLSTDQNVNPVLEGLQRQCSTIELGEEVGVILTDYAHLKQEYLLLVERINRLETENTNLRLTVQFYQVLCLDDCA